jgi:hypothetical protein
MLFNSDGDKSPKPSIPIFSHLWKAVLATVVGATLWFNPPNVNIPDFNPVETPSVVSTSSSPLNEEMTKALTGKSLRDHEDLFKVFKGVSEYAKNATNIDTTVDVYKAIESVINTYDLKGKFGVVADLVDKKLSSIKTPAKFIDKKSEVIKLFDELADAVKYSAEHQNWEKK